VGVPVVRGLDLAFHMIPLGVVDPDFAKQQLDLMLRNDYLQPQRPAARLRVELGDVNPPVHAWSTYQLYLFDRSARRQGRRRVPKCAFSKLPGGTSPGGQPQGSRRRHVFEGGFSRLDNIGVFDRSSPLPPAPYLDQADGTRGWCSSARACCAIAAELALHEPLYEEFVREVLSATLFIAGAMERVGERHDEMWDRGRLLLRRAALSRPARRTRLKVRSMVGLLPLAAVAGVRGDILAKLPRFRERARAFGRRHPDLVASVHLPSLPGVANRRMLSILDERKLRPGAGAGCSTRTSSSARMASARCRACIADPALTSSTTTGRSSASAYVHRDSRTAAMFGAELQLARAGLDAGELSAVSALVRLYTYYGDAFRVEWPRTGSGKDDDAVEVAEVRLGERLGETLRGAMPRAKRPVYGATGKFQDRPARRTLLQFFEYFHGD